MTEAGTDRLYDVALVGAGPIGIAAALAFARDGLRTCLIGAPDLREDGRTVALLEGSVRLLGALAVWPSLVSAAAPLKIMRIVDDTGSLFRAPPVAFEAVEIGLEAFGWNVANTTLVKGLIDAARSTENLSMVDAQATGFAAINGCAEVALAQGKAIRAQFVVAADGRSSVMRERAGLNARSWSYPQAAVTAVLAHDREHENASTEFHTRGGPFTLVPLPGRRSSLVWVNEPREAKRLRGLGDHAFTLEVERQAQSLLGRMRVEGGRGLVPMTGLSADRYIAERLALVGEAAHVFPPIGAQGLNLGFRDVAALRDAVLDARQSGTEIGSGAALATYQRGRELDVRLRTAAVDGLNRSLLAGFMPVDFARGVGLLALANIGPLRRAVMREGVSPSLATPRLMQAAASGRAGLSDRIHLDDAIRFGQSLSDP